MGGHFTTAAPAPASSLPTTWNCSEYNSYLQQNAVAKRFLSTKPCYTKELILWDLGINATTMQDLAPAIKFFTNLEVLDLGWNIIGTDGAKLLAEILPYLPHLKSLLLYVSHMGSAGMKFLANTINGSHLEDLNLGFSGIDFSGAEDLASILWQQTGLTKLNFDYLPLTNDIAITLIPAFQRMIHLKSLILTNNLMSDQCLNDFMPAFQGLSNLQFLYLGYNNYFSAASVASALMYLPNLEELSMPSISTLWSGGSTSTFFSVLKNRTALKTLNLASTSLTFSTAMTLLANLPANLESLDLRDNSLSSSEITALNATLQNRIALKVTW